MDITRHTSTDQPQAPLAADSPAWLALCDRFPELPCITMTLNLHGRKRLEWARREARRIVGNDAAALAICEARFNAITGGGRG